MKKVVLTFGLISGPIISVLMGGSLLLADKIGSGHSMTLGYTIMVASFVLVYFGIRSYRDNTLAARSLCRAFACGILITLITTVCYVAMREMLYFNFMPHFMDSYFAAEIHQVQSAGLDPATTATQVAANPALAGAVPEPLRQHGLHLHGTAPGGPHHHPGVGSAPPPQSPCRTHRREHVIVDFIGAQKTGRDRWNVRRGCRPHAALSSRRQTSGVRGFVDCTPAYVGRDPRILKKLAQNTGLHILTNTGYYGDGEGRYLPPSAHTETAAQIAARWLAEWRDGIEDTGVRPGFVKTRVDGSVGDRSQMTEMDGKFLAAAARSAARLTWR